MSIAHFELVKLSKGSFSCEIIANYGAALNSYKYNDFEFVDGYHHPEEIIAQQYKGVILAPFPNRIAKAQYSFQGKDFTLEINRTKESLALHGLLYNKAFTIEKSSRNECVLSFNYTELAPGFPFPFRMEISYLLEENGCLRVNAMVENTGKNPMPFGLGWHPYFRIDESIDTMFLHFPQTDKLLLSDKLLPTGKQAPFTHNLEKLDLSAHQFDDCFVLKSEDQIVFTLQGKERQLAISTQTIKDYPYFQIYTPKDRKSIAIEPMTCIPDAFNNGLGLHILEAQESKSFAFQLSAS